MVALVVLLTVGSLITNGLLVMYTSISERMREMTRERIEILTGPGGEMLDPGSVPRMGRERLEEISKQIPMLLRRNRLTRAAVLVIYSAIGVLGLSIIAIAVAEDTETIARVALALTGTIILILGIAVAGVSLAKSADAITYAVERTVSLGR
jgi:hypothetical protein